MPGESANYMAGDIIPAQSRRRALRLIEIKLGIIEFAFGVDRQMAVHEILRTRKRIQPYSLGQTSHSSGSITLLLLSE